MTKFVYCLAICALLGQISMARAEEAIGEDLLLGASVGGVDSVPEDADEGPKDDKVASFISMITKPLSLFFSADDEVGEDGKKESRCCMG